MKSFDQIFNESRAYEKSHPMYGGTYKVHYMELGIPYVCYVEAYSPKRNGIRQAVIEVAQDEQYVDPNSIIRIERYA